MVRGPAYGPLVDLVQLAATSWVPALITLPVNAFEELSLAASHSSRDGSVVPPISASLSLLCIKMF